MLSFGLLTIRHIRQLTQRITDQNNTNQRRRQTKSFDRQLIEITLIQSILFGLTSATDAIGGMYNTIDDNSHTYVISKTEINTCTFFLYHHNSPPPPLLYKNKTTFIY
jgi:hypothetical protein